MQRAVELVGGRFVDVVGIDAFEAALGEHRPRLAVATPITPAKHHLPVPDLVRFVELSRREGATTFVDDAHMASRVGFYDDPLPFQCAAIDLAILSTDKHILGPRAGVVVGRKDLVSAVRSRAMEFGLECQSGHYTSARRALERHRLEPIKRAGELAREVLARMERKYGSGRFYLAGPGVAISGEEALALALKLSGKPSAALVPNEAATVVCNHMLREHGVLTVSSVSMPGSAPVVRAMMFPDGVKLGAERVVAALEDGLARRRDAAAERLDFETAALYRDGIDALDRALESRRMLTSAVEGLNVLAVCRSTHPGWAELFVFGHGRLLARRRVLARDGETERSSVAGLLEMVAHRWHLEGGRAPLQIDAESLDQVNIITTRLESEGGRATTITPEPGWANGRLDEVVDRVVALAERVGGETGDDERGSGPGL